MRVDRKHHPWCHLETKADPLQCTCCVKDLNRLEAEMEVRHHLIAALKALVTDAHKLIGDSIANDDWMDRAEELMPELKPEEDK